MINKERMLNEFIELVGIDSLSRQERQMADCLTKKLQDMGYEVYEDDAGSKVGGNSGNIICNIKGDKNAAPILLMAHMDTVTPGVGKKHIVKDGYIKSDGTTVLGGDDMAGAECILEAIRRLKEEKVSHGDIQIVFSICEEVGLLGSKNLDYSKINAKFGFVLDSGGKIGSVSVNAPAQNKIEVTVKGKAAHAGMEPENGISAIQIASDAISMMKLGRIDEETTANVGIINGGSATNIICDTVELKAEARSRDLKKLETQSAHMKECFEKAAHKFGGSVDVRISNQYPPFKIEKSDEIINILEKGAKNAGIELILEVTGGGSDTNILNGKGIQAVDLSVGMDKVHTVQEQLLIDDLYNSAEFLIEIIKSVD